MSISFLLSCRLDIFSSFSLSSYLCGGPEARYDPEARYGPEPLTALCCTASKHWMSSWVHGDQAAAHSKFEVWPYILLIEAQEHVSVPEVEYSGDLCQDS